MSVVIIRDAARTLGEVAERMRWGSTTRDWAWACAESLERSRARRAKIRWWHVLADGIVFVAVCWAFVAVVMVMAILAQRI